MKDAVRGRCVVEIEDSFDSFHAYAVPEDVLIEPGDVVLVHDAPTGTGGAPVLRRTCAISVRRAGPIGRAWTRFVSHFQLTSLYEVGFEPKDAAP